MKCFQMLLSGLLMLPVAISPVLAGDSLGAGHVDFGSFEAPKSGEYVDVNLPSNLIALAARFVERQEPDVAKVLRGIKLVRVNVFGLTEENKANVLDRAKALRADLGAKGWERLVTVMKERQDVGVYLKMDEQSAIQGLAVVVLDGEKHAVFVNVVGDIKPEQLSMLGERLHIEPLKDLIPKENNEK